MVAAFAWAVAYRSPSAHELASGTAAPPLLVMNNQQAHQGLTYRVVRSLVHLNLAQHPIGPTSSRAATEAPLADAFHTLLHRVRDAIQARSFLGPTMPVHARFRCEAIEYSPHPGDAPRMFWVCMTMTVESWETAHDELLTQIHSRYSDDGYLDELGSDHDTQNQTYVVRIECELLMQADALGNGGCSKSVCTGKEKWEQSSAEDKHFFRVLPVKSQQNNCAIACLATYSLQGGWLVAQRVKYNALRRELGIAEGVLLSFEELDRVATRMATNYQVYDISGERIHYGACYAHDVGRCANLLSAKGHYQLILHQVGQCACGKPDGEGHTCAYKGGFCSTCQTHHPNMSHDCPYASENIAARAIQNLAADALRREQVQRDAATRENIDARLDGMEHREDFEPILECVFKLQRSCLVLGPGGVGKTFIALREVRGVIEDGGGKVKVFCPTGQAATLHDDATTAHYGLKLRTGTDSLQKITSRFKESDYDDWEPVTHVLLDEISMFDAALTDLLDLVIRHLKRRPAEPFGGCILVGVGDFLQLKPVSATHLFFDAEVVRTMIEQQKLGIYYLSKPVRYPNVKWFDLLSRVRIGKPNASDIVRLRLRMKPLEKWCEEKSWNEQTMPVLACPKNKEADTFNIKCANMLKAQGKKVARFVRVDKKAAQGMRPQDLTKLAPKSVELIEDAKVMLLVNHIRGKGAINLLETYGIGNGSVGHVHAFGTADEPGALVRFRNGAEVFIGYHVFDETVSQIPLRLAYASSIHKLQGTTLDEALLSLAGCFCESQAYAALSRVCREENCYITSLNVNALKWVDQRCVAMSVASTKKPLPRLEMSETGEWNDPLTIAPYMRAKVKTLPRGDSETVSKVIYFDAETFHNAKGELECYHMEVQKVTHGHTLRRNWTKNDEDHDVLLDFCEFIRAEIFADVEKYVRCSVRNAEKLWCEKPFILAAYNGANFDFHMLIKYLFQSGLTSDFKVNMMFKGSTAAYFDLWHVPSGKQCVVLHDLCRLLMCSLAKASQDMLGVNLKGIFPHRHMNRFGWSAISEEEQPRLVARADFFEKDYASLDKLYGKVDEIVDLFPVISDVIFDPLDRKFISARIDLRACLLQYGGMDVDILRQLYKRVDDTVRSTFQASVTGFYSANQLSRYGVLMHLPRVARLSANGHHAKYIESQLFCLSKEMDGWVTEAMYGGRTLPRQTHFKSRHIAAFDAQDLGMGPACSHSHLAFEVAPGKDEEFFQDVDALLFLDIFSMYVSIMKTREFSFGPPKWMNDDVVNELQLLLVNKDPFADATRALANLLVQGDVGHFILDIDMELHSQDVEPPVPYRDDGVGHHGKVMWDSKRRRGKYTHVDIGLVLRNYGRINAIYGGISWPQRGKIFEAYMDQTLAWKQRGEDTGNEALRSFGKLCGNTVFGGMCMRTHSNAVAMCMSDAEVELFLKDNTWEGAYGYQDGMLMWGKRKSIDEEGIGVQVYSPTAKQIGCLVLAYARDVIDTFCNAANPYRGQLMRSSPAAVGGEAFELLQQLALENQPYYGDTDSLMIHAKQYRNVRHLLKDAPGYWTDDLNKKWETKDPMGGELVRTLAIVLEYYGAAPKSYGIRYCVPKCRPNTDDDKVFLDLRSDGSLICEYDLSSLKEKFKFKGVPKGIPVSINGTQYAEMNLALLRRIMCSGLSYMDAEEEALPQERPTVELSSIGKVGFKPSTHDYFAGIAPFSLKPVAIRRSLFQTRFTGRKIAHRRGIPGSPLLNDVLAPISMPLGSSEM
jgi:hypothetical protein